MGLWTGSKRGMLGGFTASLTDTVSRIKSVVDVSPTSITTTCIVHNRNNRCLLDRNTVDFITSMQTTHPVYSTALLISEITSFLSDSSIDG